MRQRDKPKAQKVLNQLKEIQAWLYRQEQRPGCTGMDGVLYVGAADHIQEAILNMEAQLEN